MAFHATAHGACALGWFSGKDEKEEDPVAAGLPELARAVTTTGFAIFFLCKFCCGSGINEASVVGWALTAGGMTQTSVFFVVLMQWSHPVVLLIFWGPMLALSGLSILIWSFQRRLFTETVIHAPPAMVWEILIMCQCTGENISMFAKINKEVF